MSDVKQYPRQKKEPEMLNDFGPAGGYDCLYPASESGKFRKNNNKVNLKGSKENMLGERYNDILNPSEEKGE